MGDIALPDVNYESEWSLKNIKSAQQEEIEKLKKEVYQDGLQVEEEGLTDILRKKIKQEAPNHDDSLKNNNDKLLNEAMIVSNEIIFFSSYIFHLLNNSQNNVSKGRPFRFHSLIYACLYENFSHILSLFVFVQ